jgi:EpsI family protein
VTRQRRFFVIALAMLGAAGTALAVPRGAADVALRQPLDAVPTVLGPWSLAAPPAEEILPPDPRATQSLTRGYARGARPVWVAVGYYANQTEGRRPATRSLVFPASGWTDLSEERISLPASGPAGRPLAANLVVVRRGERRVAMVYWYQLADRLIESDHLYRARLLWNRLAEGRADGALVRVALPLPDGASAAAVVAEHAEFFHMFVAELARTLPA